VLSQAAREDDVIGLTHGPAGAMVAVLTVRRGQVQGSEAFELEGAADMAPADILNGFVGQFYADAASYPKNILLPMPISDADLLASLLTERRGSKVEISVPQRGDRKRLVEMAQKNAEEAMRQATIKKDYDADRAEALLADLQEALGMDTAPRRIECYDISNLMGTDPVGSMVVFEEGRPKPAHYRRFHIKGVSGANDFAMMQEMLRRRFARLAAASKAGGDASDTSFASLPDLVIIDGGKGQLSAALAVMEELQVHQIDTVGLAKRKEELYRPNSARSLMLPLDSPALFLLQRVRDEAHRFAITFHRRARAKTTLTSPLDSVAGLGPKRKRALIKRFRSLQGIKDASLDELLEVIPARVAEALREQV
jgi:excinuclease ABC subunit C